MLTMTDIPPDLSVPEAARRLGVSTDTIKRGIKAGLLPAHKIGARGDWRITDADLQAWLERGAPTGKGHAKAHDKGAQE